MLIDNSVTMHLNNGFTKKNCSQIKDYFASFSWEFKTILGVYKLERKKHQNIKINLEIKLVHKCFNESQKDNDFEHIIRNYLSHEKPYLLERMAYDLARAILKKYPSIPWLRLTIVKPEALIEARNAFVTISYDAF